MTAKTGTPPQGSPAAPQGRRRPPPPRIPYVRDFDPRYGEAVEVGPSLRRVTCRNPGPFTGLGTNSFIVGPRVRGGKVAVVDPGPEDADHLAALLRAVEGQRVAAVLVTHTHGDHSPLARSLAEAVGGCPVLGRADPAVETGELAGDARFRPDRELAEGEEVSGDGWRLETIATPGHASNHLCFALDGATLLAGDHVMGWSTTIVSPPDGDMDAYLASLDKVAARGFSVLHPAHGPPITEVAPFLMAYKAHRLHRELQVREALAKGLETIPALVSRLYADVDPRLHPAAARSVLAHLIRLERLGEVRREGEAYRPA